MLYFGTRETYDACFSRVLKKDRTERKGLKDVQEQASEAAKVSTLDRSKIPTRTLQAHFHTLACLGYSRRRS